MKTVIFIIKIFASAAFSLAILWLLIWNGIECYEFKFDWSESNMILSAQKVIEILWLISMILSPVIWIALTYTCVSYLFNLKYFWQSDNNTKN